MSAAQDGLGTPDEFDEKALHEFEDCLRSFHRSSCYPECSVEELRPVLSAIAAALRAEREAGIQVGLAQQAARERTHANGCFLWGHAHYGCALAEIDRLNAMLPEPPK